MVVFMACAKLGPVSCNTTRSPVLAVIVGTVGVLLRNGSRCSRSGCGQGGAQTKKQYKKSPAIHGCIRGVEVVEVVEVVVKVVVVVLLLLE